MLPGDETFGRKACYGGHPEVWFTVLEKSVRPPEKEISGCRHSTIQLDIHHPECNSFDFFLTTGLLCLYLQRLLWDAMLVMVQP